MRRFSAEARLSPSFVSQVVNEKLPISNKLAAALGLRRVVEYEITGSVG